MKSPLEGREERIAVALDTAVQYGGIDGAHHKTWVIDQMVRALTGCPLVEASSTDGTHKWYNFGESKEYLALVAAACAGEDGPDTYEWDEGVAP